MMIVVMVVTMLMTMIVMMVMTAICQLGCTTPQETDQISSPSQVEKMLSKTYVFKMQQLMIVRHRYKWCIMKNKSLE